MIRLDGKKIAEQIEQELYPITSIKLHHLALIQIGNDFSSSIYIRKKLEACERLKVKTSLIKRIDIKQAELISLINELNYKPSVHGILVQLPLPKNFNVDVVLNAISPMKDVDVFLPATENLVTLNNQSPVPCVVNGILHLKKAYDLDWNKKQIVVVGKGKTGGQPIINWLQKHQYWVQGYEKNDADINIKIQDADVLITAIGNPCVIDSSKLKKGCAFFDVGISRDINNRVIGDINFEIASQTQAAYGTPVPGGIGPMTIVMLLKNLMILKQIQDESK